MEMASLVPTFGGSESEVVEGDGVEQENLKEQVTGFLKSWCELVQELGRGCRDVLQQTVVTEDSLIVQKLGGSAAKVSGRLRFLNEFLPEDRDPVHVWPVIFFVFILAFSGIEFIILLEFRLLNDLC